MFKPLYILLLFSRATWTDHTFSPTPIRDIIPLVHLAWKDMASPRHPREMWISHWKSVFFELWHRYKRLHFLLGWLRSALSRQHPMRLHEFLDGFEGNSRKALWSLVIGCPVNHGKRIWEPMALNFQVFISSNVVVNSLTHVLSLVLFLYFRRVRRCFDFWWTNRRQLSRNLKVFMVWGMKSDL